MNRQPLHDTSESVEEYLEALWISAEEGKPVAKIVWVARRLGVAPPSVVEMFKRLEEQGLVKYSPYRGVGLAEAGRTIARRMVRNHRLVEFLMKQTLNIDADEGIACGVEHHMTEEFTDALCSLLGHPRKCPHGNQIPRGKCCEDAEKARLPLGQA
jgi:DtxR family Mn-dependent transcriptional regulator